MQKLIYVGQFTYTFHYTETIYIKCVVQENEPKDLYYDSWATIFFTDNEKTKRLAFSIVYEKLYDFSYFLKKSLHKENIVDEQHIQDIGFLFNEMHYRKSMLHEKIMLNELYDHVMWSPVVAEENIQTWLYNNTNGEIILFLAPVYPFFFTKPCKKNPSYQEWIKAYKPFGRYIIAQDIAQQWLKQAHDIMNLIETNSASKST
ncbi:MAG TPA: hypothetical protein VL201_01525 [Patescibacteria group bacterium]|nr:hypothetical protein [Patescibacteria group bacterium]